MALIQDQIALCIEGHRLLCNNDVQLRQMKRLFPINLALLLVISSLGHAFAAAFCPHVLGRECCFAKTHKHSPTSIHEHMAVHDVDGMSMDASSTDHTALNDVAIDATTVDMSVAFSPHVLNEGAAVRRFNQPVESCPHCLGHSGIVNAPVSFVRVSDPSGKEIGSVLLPVLRFLIRPAIAPAQIGLLREHAPPGTSAPRYILTGVFLI